MGLGEGLSLGRTRRIDYNAIASRVVTPLGRRRARQIGGLSAAEHMDVRERPSVDQNAPRGAFCRTERLSPKPNPPKPKNPPEGGFLILVGPGGFEPPTSTMSRPIGRTKTRVDAQNLTPFYFVFTPRLGLF